jgi:hypothetical protein
MILSEFTGSASIFGDNALLVNPWDFHQCANAIHELVAGQVHSLSKAGDYQHVCYRDECDVLCRQEVLPEKYQGLMFKGRINSAYTTLEHQPLIFLRQDLLSAQYVALITVADSATVMSATYCADRRSCLRNIKG